MNKNSFKDQCDICNKFDYLKSFDNKCLCSECYKKLNIKNSQKIIKKLKFESNFCWFSEDIFGKIPVQISIIFCTQKTERQKFIDFGQNILWALCEWNAMINTLKYTK